MGGRTGMRSNKPHAPDLAGTKPGTDVMPTLDGRRRFSRAVNRSERALYADVGGSEALSHVQRALCRRFVLLEAWQSMFEAKLANGEPVGDLIGVYLQSVNVSIGLARSLGVKRRARDMRLAEVLRKGAA